MSSRRVEVDVNPHKASTLPLEAWLRLEACDELAWASSTERAEAIDRDQLVVARWHAEGDASALLSCAAATFPALIDGILETDRNVRAAARARGEI